MDITTIADMLASSYRETYNIGNETIPVTVDESNFALCVAMIKTITTILQEEKTK